MRKLASCLIAALCTTALLVACSDTGPTDVSAAAGPERPQFDETYNSSGSSIEVGTVSELVDAMASAAATGWPQEIEIEAGYYGLIDTLPRIHGDLHITGEGEETVIDAAALPVVGISPGAFSQRAVFDIVGGDVVIEELVVQNGDVGIRVTDGTVIKPGAANQSHCDRLDVSTADHVQNIRIEAVRFYNFFEALRASTHARFSLTDLDLSRLYFDGNVEGVVITNDCHASGSVIDFTADDIIVRNTRPEPPGGELGLTGVGLAAGNFGQSRRSTVTGRVADVTVDNDGPPSGSSVIFCGGCFGAVDGTTNVDAKDLTINKVEFGLELIGGLVSSGNVLNATASDVTANTAGPGLFVSGGGVFASNNHTDAKVSHIDLSGVNGRLVGVAIQAGEPAGNSVVLDLSDARIDHFRGAFLSQANGFEAGENSLHATFTDVFYCGYGPPGLFIHFDDGNASLTVDGQPEPGPQFFLPPCM